MKKILAVLIAISMVATMAFAADFSFEVKNNGDLLNWSTDAADTVTLLDNQGYNGEGIATLEAKVEDMAGVSMTITNSDGGDPAKGEKSLTVSRSSIWIKPVEGVKITLAGAGFNVGKINDTFGTYGATLKSDAFAVEYTGVKNLTVNVGLSKIVTPSKPALAAKVAYTVSEAATIAATCDTELMIGAAVNGKVSIVDYIAMVEYKDNVKVAEKATFDLAPVSVWEAVEFKAEGSALTVMEGLTCTIAPVTIDQNAKWVKDGDISADVKATVKVASVEAWAKVSTADVTGIASNVALTAGAKVPFSGNIGSAAWTLDPEVDVDILQNFKVGVKVPYSVKIAF